MRSIAIIAGGVFRDSIRDRIGYGLVFFSIMLMASSFLLAQLTAGQDVKIIKDLGLAPRRRLACSSPSFFGIGLVTKEVERRSIYSLLSKPVTRTQFVVGKYLGLVLTLLINLSVMVVAFYAVLWYLDFTTVAGAKAAWETPAMDPRMLKAFALIGVELMLITATAHLLLDVLEPVSLGGADLRGVHRRALRRGPEEPQRDRRVGGAAVHHEGRLLRHAEPQRPRRQVGRRPRAAGERHQHAAGDRLVPAVHRDPARRGRSDLLEARSEVDEHQAGQTFGDACGWRWSCSLVSATTTQVVLEGKLQRPAIQPSVHWIQSPGLMRRLAVGYNAIWADIYWIRAVQYYGGTKLSVDEKKNYDQLYPLLDITTSLDPALQHRVQVRVDSAVRRVSERTGQDRPGDHAAAEGHP